MRAIACFLLAVATSAAASGGYFRFPSIHGDTVVFTAEGDLWRVSAAGGDAHRLTSHPGTESHPAISPDGKWVAFTGSYDGPFDVYVMPLSGGVPRRLTAFGDRVEVVGWNGNGEVLATTRYFHGLRKLRLIAISVATRAHRVTPLEQAGTAAMLEDSTLVYTRGDRRGDNVRGYRGGAMQRLWRFRPGSEATALTKDDVNSAHPLAWKDRIVFCSDRDGVINLWSMSPSGEDLRQHTRHRDFEIGRPSIFGDRVVYQHGADLRLIELASGDDHVIPIRLVSDFEHQRERWVTKPLDNFSSAAISANGERVVIVARGALVTAGVGNLRRIDIGLPKGTRARSAELMPDQKGVLVIADISGEMELWLFPADGSGPGRQLTRDASATRLQARPSPDGKWIAHTDRRRRLWLLEVASGRNRLLHEGQGFGNVAFENITWAPDSSAFAVDALMGTGDRAQIILYRVTDGYKLPIASSRYASFSASFSSDGKWLWFLANRHFQALSSAPWGDRNTGPYFDKRTRAYAIALQPGNRFPMQPRDELEPPKPEPEKPDPAKPPPVRVEPPRLQPPPTEQPKLEPPKPEPVRPESPPSEVPMPPTPADPPRRGEPRGEDGQTTDLGSPAEAPGAASPVEPSRPVRTARLPAIVWDNISQRLYEVPLPPGNYTKLASDGKRLWYLEAETTPQRKTTLKSMAIDNSGVPAEVFSADVRQFAISGDGKKLFLRKWAAAPSAGDMFIVDPTPRPPQELQRFQIRLSDWQYPIAPVEEWKEIFADSWRMHRDWFYDKDLHGVDWPAMRRKYGTLLPRVTDREELLDLLGQMSAELSLLHSQVGRGDLRRGQPNIVPATLGARFEKTAEGVRLAQIYRADPELVSDLPPLARTEVGARQGDILVAINGRSVKEVADVFLELRDRAGKQVLLELKSPGAPSRKAIATPVDANREIEFKRRDHEWRMRENVERASKGRFGYIYLRAMGTADLASFVREFYPIYEREGLIIDVRGNSGGNIDSILIEKLMRRPWAYWRSNTGALRSNMQAAFRGPMVVLIDQDTYSDGETFAEGMRKLGLATLVGERTTGAGVWLGDTNVQLDGGISRAAETAQLGLDGAILVEGVGVKPDVAIENPPNATFRGEDAQLAEAMRILERKVAEQPVRSLPPPAYPRLKR